MRVLILGDGLLATELVNQTSWSYLSRKKDNFDISNINQFSDLINQYDVLVNCIAFTKTYDSNKVESWNVNVKFCEDLINFCNLHDKKLVHISSDYLYHKSAITEI